MGYDISRLGPASSPLVRRRKLLKSYAINVVLDVGANAGQFAMQMRNLGFFGKIVSFEPLGSAFELLRQNADKDPKWEIINCALGEINAAKKINVSANSCSSSLLDMLPAHTKAAPEKIYVAKELIEVRTLDSMINDLCAREDNIYLKIDTQGYESRVISGADEALARIGTIQLEMSLVPLYDEELLFGEMHSLLSEKGYSMVSIEAVYSDRTSGQLLQVDGIYHRF